MDGSVLMMLDTAGKARSSLPSSWRSWSLETWLAETFLPGMISGLAKKKPWNREKPMSRVARKVSRSSTFSASRARLCCFRSRATARMRSRSLPRPRRSTLTMLTKGKKGMSAGWPRKSSMARV